MNKGMRNEQTINPNMCKVLFITIKINHHVHLANNVGSGKADHIDCL